MWRNWKSMVGWLFLAGAVVVASACGGSPPAEMEPEPTQPETEVRERDTDAEAERERARLEEEERRRRAAERERVLSILRERVHFDFDKSEIRTDAEEVLQRKVTVLREYPDIRLRVEGHADERGSNEYNLALGQRRAESVRRFLVSFGLTPGRFETISYGEERPLVNQSNEEAWAQNRRAEFVIMDEGRLGGDD